MLDITSLSPDDLNALRAALGIAGDTFGRSPVRERQLHDLTLLPTATDPRPTFFWSAEKPRNDPPQRAPFARLMWDGTTGREITVRSPEELATYTAKGFVLTAPGNAEAPDPADAVRAALEALSPEDRKTVLMAAQTARLARVQEMAAGLSESDFEQLLASMEPTKRRKEVA